MKITDNQLHNVLAKSLAPIYLISGDETLLVEEASQLIRDKIYAQGFTERQIFQVTPKFDWTTLLAHANSLSLFNDKSLLELRIPNGKLNEAGKKSLLTYATQPASDKILLIITSKLSAAVQNSKWFKTIEKIGVVVQIWPITPQQLPNWIMQRLKQHNITTEPDAIKLLTESTEGNLLATKQEIEKLILLYDKKHLTTDDILAAISDHARFDIFTLADAALGGDIKRTLRIMMKLQNEGVEPTLVLWTLAREIRSLINMAYQLQQGSNINNILYHNHVWEKRKPLVRLSLKRHTTTSLVKLLQYAAKIDRLIKGIDNGNIWDSLSQLAFKLCK